MTVYRWWTVRAWCDPRDIGVKCGPVTIAVWQTLDDRWVPGIYVLNRWVWEGR